MRVHWGGYPLDLEKIRDIRGRFRGKHGWAPALIEDGAHAFGSKYKGKYLGLKMSELSSNMNDI